MHTISFIQYVIRACAREDFFFFFFEKCLEVCAKKCNFAAV